MQKIIYVTFALMLPILVQGQDVTTHTIAWQAEYYTNVQNGEQLYGPVTITTQGKQTITWKAADGTVSYTFTIKEVLGQWPDVKKKGSITYEVTADSAQGTITLDRTDKHIRIGMTLLQEGQTEGYEFIITDYKIL